MTKKALPVADMYRFLHHARCALYLHNMLSERENDNVISRINKHYKPKEGIK
jgi:hypothetical protein